MIMKQTEFRQPLWKQLLQLLWPGVIPVLAFGASNPALSVALVLLGIGSLGCRLNDRRMRRRRLPASPYEPIACRYSSLSSWWWFGICIAMQPLLFWSMRVALLDYPMPREQHFAQLIVPTIMELVIFSQAVLYPLRRHWGWWRDLQIDPAGILIPSLSKSPIAWCNIAEMKLVWQNSYPLMTLRLRQPIAAQDRIESGWTTTWSADRRSATFQLYGWTCGAEALSQAILQRWHAFGGPGAAMLVPVEAATSDMLHSAAGLARAH